MESGVNRHVRYQLRVLKDSKLVRFRREGKTVFYALDDDHVRSILSMVMALMANTPLAVMVLISA